MKYERKNNTMSFKSILPDILEILGIRENFSIQKLNKDWNIIVGNILAIHSYPSKVEDDCLYIYSDHSVFSNEIIMQKVYILRKINELYINRDIKKIRIDSSRRK